MTREFYLECNCSKNTGPTTNAGNWTFSNPFKLGIGGLIVNANTTFFTSCAEYGDWYCVPKEKSNLNLRFGIALFDSSNDINQTTCLSQACGDYRKHDMLGQPYYKSDKKQFKEVVCHPLAFYTNAIHYAERSVLYFPFYSLDFMYRFYEIFRKKCRGWKSPNRDLLDDFYYLDSQKKDAVDELLCQIGLYIPMLQVGQIEETIDWTDGENEQQKNEAQENNDISKQSNLQSMPIKPETPRDLALNESANEQKKKNGKETTPESEQEGGQESE